jgi:hypothetical protein
VGGLGVTLYIVSLRVDLENLYSLSIIASAPFVISNSAPPLTVGLPPLAIDVKPVILSAAVPTTKTLPVLLFALMPRARTFTSIEDSGSGG